MVNTDDAVNIIDKSRTGYGLPVNIPNIIHCYFPRDTSPIRGRAENIIKVGSTA